jgi:hypothetical protein
MVENHSQMLKGPRFTWFYWSQAISAQWTELPDGYVFKGEISALRFLNPRAVHQRIVIKKKNKLEWIIVDKVDGLPGTSKKQIWHHDGHRLKLQATLKPNQNAKETKAEAPKSYYYGLKEKGESTLFEFDSEISTTVTVLE